MAVDPKKIGAMMGTPRVPSQTKIRPEEAHAQGQTKLNLLRTKLDLLNKEKDKLDEEIRVTEQDYKRLARAYGFTVGY